MKMHFNRHTVGFLVLMLLAQWGSAQDSLTINLVPIGTIEGSVRSVTDNILMNVTNNYGVAMNVYFVVNVDAVTEDGRRIHLDNERTAAENSVPVGAGGLSANLTTLIEVYQNSTFDDFTVTPASLLSQIQDNQQLPAGDYTICVEARSVATDRLLSSAGENNCIRFDIEYRTPPIIQSPQDNTWVGEDEFDNIQIIWTHDRVDSDTEYDIEIVRFPNEEAARTFREQGLPNHLFETYERVLLEEGWSANSGWTYNTVNADVVPVLEVGDFLAVRITTRSENDVFINEGRSAIHQFIYGVPGSLLCQNPNITIDWVFPVIGDTLPYTDLFPVARFQPSCDNILGMEGSMAFIRRSSSGVAEAPVNYTYDNDWRSGPGPSRYLRSYFTRHFPDFLDFFYPDGSEYEQYIPFLHGRSRFSAERGEQVHVFGEVTFTKTVIPGNTELTQRLSLNSMNGSGVIIGMPRPRLISPENDAIVTPGNIEFQFSTGEQPTEPLPPFKIFKLEGDRDPIIQGLSVKEKCVLQVSKDRAFSAANMVFCRLKKIQANPYDNTDVFDDDNPAFEPVSATFDRTAERRFDDAHFLEGLYKDVTVSQPITEEDTLYWRVVWLKQPADINVLSPCSSGIVITSEMIYHESEIRRLIIDRDGGEGDDELDIVECAAMYPEESDEGDDESAEGECSSPCRFPVITDITSSGPPAAGNSFTVAGFTCETESYSGTSGLGYVVIPYMNNIKVKVTLSNIQLNAARQMVSGTVTPVRETVVPMSEHTSSFGRLVGMDEAQADGFEAGLEAGGKLLSLLSNGSKISLPIGIDKTIDGTRVIVGITNMTFKKDTSHMEMVVNIRIPNMEFVNGFISLGAQVCMTHEGLANDVRLFLPQDQVIPMGGGSEFRLEGAEGESNPRNVTSVEFDCQGFRALQINGKITFTRDWILPVDASGRVAPTGNIQATFSGRFTRGNNIIVRLSMDRFQIPGADGWVFQPGYNVWMDLSDLENPTNFRSALPRGYIHPALAEPATINTWKGFYLEEISVATPERLQGPDRNPLTFAIRNMFVDNTGLSMSVRAENILRWDGNGNMNGWAVSLDTVFFDMMQNNFRAAGFNGKLGLPIADRTQYMIYQAELRQTTDSTRTATNRFNFVLSVRPVGNLHIPISMAQATIRSDSYVRASLGADNYIEANLSASLQISNSHLPSGTTMPSSVSMPGIRVENLRLHSDTGFDTTDFSFALTGMPGAPSGDMPGSSGGGGGESVDQGDDDDTGPYEPSGVWRYVDEAPSESTMSGFPIGLDHFSIANDKITIQPRLTLSGSDGGFSAAAKIALLINMDLLSSPQQFSLTGVNLERIELDVHASDVKLKGYLEFYKTATDEGVKGGITMEINMGTRVGVNINADFGCRKLASATTFNTPDWFAYFYVDGTAVLSPGITLFSGVSLYGLGGGFYHHMRMTNDVPAGGAVLTGARGPSGIRYEPHFTTDLGLKFKVILGSNDNGQAYNLDVALQAEFSFSHGLTLLDIKGSFRVMTDGISVSTIGREGNSPVAGYVGMTLNMPAAGPTTFNGQFFVKVRVPYGSPLLTGIGSIPSPPPGWTSDNAMVWATFLASEGNNYFHMGTPTNRGGLRLGFGSSDLIRVTAYLMIGDGIPVVMPEPDAEFTRIFNRGMAASRSVQSLDGDVNALLAGNPRASAPPTGSGFAMGMSLLLNTGDIEFFPFFFNLKAIMGCDINVTQASAEAERRCAGSDRVPGSDGWYATGQFYAGIEGAFGLKINLFVREFKVNILEASAAIILRGGLPNPEWVSGRGSFYYNVCGGLAEGNCNFTLEAGTVCLPVTGNPFAGIKMIQDITPPNGQTDVSVYTDAAVAFSMDMNRVYEFEEMVSTIDPPVIRRIQPYMKSFELRREGTTINLAGTGEWSEDNHIYTFVPDLALAPRQNFTVRVEARIRENGSDMTVRGSVFREELIHRFTTGNEPDKIVDENISFTYPYIYQQTFFKGETQGGLGYIRCRTPNGRWSTGGDVSETVTRFYVKFTDEDNVVTTVPAMLMPQNIGVQFDVSRLSPDKLYCVQVIRKDEPIYTNTRLELGPGVDIDEYLRPAGTLLNRASQNLIVANFATSVGASTLRSNQFKRIKLPSGKVGRYETEIYAYYFRTSQYNTMAEKMEANSSAWNTENITFGVELARIDKRMTENVEWVDIQSFKVVSQRHAKELTKRIDFILQEPAQSLDGIVFSTPLPVNQYLREIISRRILGFSGYAQAVSIRSNLVARAAGLYPGGLTIPTFGTIPGYTAYSQKVYFNSNTAYIRPLSSGEINSAFTESVDVPPMVTGLPTPLTGISLPGGAISSTLTATKPTIINYEPTVEGLEHYRQLRAQLNNFVYAPVRSVGIFVSSVYDLLSPGQQSFFNTHAVRNTLLRQANYINWTKGPQTFGIQYKFPGPDGGDRMGSLLPFTFRL